MIGPQLPPYGSNEMYGRPSYYNSGYGQQGLGASQMGGSSYGGQAIQEHEGYGYGTYSPAYELGAGSGVRLGRSYRHGRYGSRDLRTSRLRPDHHSHYGRGYQGGSSFMPAQSYLGQDYYGSRLDEPYRGYGTGVLSNPHSGVHGNTFAPFGGYSSQYPGYGHQGLGGSQYGGLGQGLGASQYGGLGQGLGASQYGGYGQGLGGSQYGGYGQGLGRSSYGGYNQGLGYSGYGHHGLGSSHYGGYGHHGLGSSNYGGYGHHGLGSSHYGGYGHNRFGRSSYGGYGNNGLGRSSYGGYGQDGLRASHIQHSTVVDPYTTPYSHPHGLLDDRTTAGIAHSAYSRPARTSYVL